MLETGLFALVLITAVGLFVKTHRGGSSSTVGISHAADSPSHEARR